MVPTTVSLDTIPLEMRPRTEPDGDETDDRDVRCVLLPGEDLVKKGSSAGQRELALSVHGSFESSQGRVEPAVSSVQDVKSTAIGIWGFSDQLG